jgi:CDP-2,3-bis-(O-geranylgeranyl)-sn-glycerol synthase
MFAFHEWIYAFWFFLPSYAANIAPVLATRFNWLPLLAHPLDAGFCWRNQPLLGKHKTLRGIVVGLAAAMATAWLQGILEQQMGWHPFPRQLPPALFGLLAGAGGLGGDLMGSFVKRRLGWGVGKPFPVLDQIDQILGAAFLLAPFEFLTMRLFVLALILTLVGGILLNFIGVQLGLKKAI